MNELDELKQILFGEERRTLSALGDVTTGGTDERERRKERDEHHPSLLHVCSQKLRPAIGRLMVAMLGLWLDTSPEVQENRALSGLRGPVWRFAPAFTLRMLIGSRSVPMRSRA